MARDFLAIQGSATPSERAFSSSSLTDTKHCSRISPPLFKAIQILKSAYRNSHVKAADQAQAHFQVLVDALDVLGDEGELEEEI
jgi:hypothetical protein